MSRAAELIDRATDNPAFDGLGGYYIFIRRVAIPLLLRSAFVCLHTTCQ